jgi:hypothetical protein
LRSLDTYIPTYSAIEIVKATLAAPADGWHNWFRSNETIATDYFYRPFPRRAVEELGLPEPCLTFNLPIEVIDETDIPETNDSNT